MGDSKIVNYSKAIAKMMSFNKCPICKGEFLNEVPIHLVYFHGINVKEEWAEAVAHGRTEELVARKIIERSSTPTFDQMMVAFGQFSQSLSPMKKIMEAFSQSILSVPLSKNFLAANRQRHRMAVKENQRRRQRCS